MADVVDRLTPLPSPGGKTPDLAPGTVAFFIDADWNSSRLDINTADYTANQRHVITSWMFDQASYVAFNLDAGTVMTLMDGL